jgi:hypothetical protein
MAASANESVEYHAQLQAEAADEGGIMVRHFGVSCALALGIVSSVTPTLAGSRSLPMQFQLRQDAAQDCTDTCRQLISAAGAITADTPNAFRKFANGRKLQGATIVLDSDGGSVLGAIALGRDIRALKLNTTVGQLTDTTPAKSGVMRAKFSSRADCESMCAFVLLGGVQRAVAPESRVMVHQIWLGDRRDDPTAGSYSAEDLVLVQRDIGRLAKYTVDMGGTGDLLEVALRIPPWEPMHALTRAELENMGFESTQTPPVETPVASISSVKYAPATSGDRTDGGLDEHGWSIVDRGGASMLGRRHPLTIEGDEIGSFDLVLTCAANDGYLVTYSEERRADIGATASPLTDVTIRIGGQTTPLKVISSEVKDKTGLLVSVAAGALPAGVIRGFMSPGSRSMMIDTSNAKTQSTIRLGNSGAQRNLPLLASHCQKGQRAELTTAKTGGMAQR